MSVTNAKGSNSTTNTALALITAFILVALIVGVLGHSNGREQERRQTLAAELAELAKDEARRECVGSDQASVFDCVHDRIVASQDQARADQDLDAQQGMKFWAAVMAVLTFLTVCVTALGVWFVKRTLDATLEAVGETSEATKAMVVSNRISENAQRPWLDVKLEVHGIAKSDRGFVMRLKLHVENVGPIPANQLRYGVDGWFYQDESHGATFADQLREAELRRDAKTKEAVERAVSDIDRQVIEGATIFPKVVYPVFIESEIEIADPEKKTGPIAWIVVAVRYSLNGGGSGETVRIFQIRSFGLPNDTGFDSIGEYGHTFTDTDAKIIDWELGGYAY